MDDVERDPTTLADALRALAAARAERDAARRQLDGVYVERDHVVALCLTLAEVAGYTVGVGPHQGPDWGPRWRTVVYVDLGRRGADLTCGPLQCSWHVPREHLPLFTGLPQFSRAWDGHTVPEKYARVRAFVASVVHRRRLSPLARDDGAEVPPLPALPAAALALLEAKQIDNEATAAAAATEEPPTP